MSLKRATFKLEFTFNQKAKLATVIADMRAALRSSFETTHANDAPEGQEDFDVIIQRETDHYAIEVYTFEMESMLKFFYFVGKKAYIVSSLNYHY